MKCYKMCVFYRLCYTFHILILNNLFNQRPILRSHSFIIITKMKVRKQFDLEKVQFTEESDDEDKLFSNQMIERYNKEYSLILSETKNFFYDCKDFIARFMTLNNMGIGFNLPFMMNAVMKIEAEAISPVRKNKQASGNWQTRKKKFEHDFAKIMDKMGQVIEQMLSFEIKIKTAYLGQAFNTPTKVKTRVNTNMTRGRNKSIGKFISENTKVQQKKDENPEQQQMLRQILQKGMTPFNESKSLVCSLTCSPVENMERLNHKLEKMKFQIKQSRSKQAKIWKIFNEKRPSRNLLTPFDSIQQNEKDQEYKKLNNMLSDMISQKNRTCNRSPYQTVDSSFQY